MRVVVAGASGFLGHHLSTHLIAEGHEVTRLVRRTAASPDESTWDPYRAFYDRDTIAGANVVINLAGAPTLGNPHSSTWAEELLTSRVTTTQVLAQAIAESGGTAHFIAGNGIAFYGDHGAERVTEASASLGDSFMTQVARQWQEATEPAAEAGARVAVLRTAPVLHSGQPPLSMLASFAKWGLATKLGSGEQYFPVISLRDWVHAVTFLIAREISGPVNLCGPEPATQAEFTDTLAQALDRKARLRAPRWAVGTLAGRLSGEVLGSLRAVPEVLVESGFSFADRSIGEIVETALLGTLPQKL